MRLLINGNANFADARGDGGENYVPTDERE